MLIKKRQLLALIIFSLILLVACKPKVEESKMEYLGDNSLNILHTINENYDFQVDELDIGEKLFDYDRTIDPGEITLMDISGQDLLLLVQEISGKRKSILKYRKLEDNIELVYDFSLDVDIVDFIAQGDRNFIIYSKGTNDEYFFGEIARNEIFQLDEIRHLFYPSMDKTKGAIYYTNLTDHRASFLNTIKKYDLATGSIEEIYTLDKENFLQGASEGIVFNPVEENYISFYSKEDREISILDESGEIYVLPSYLNESIFSYTVVEGVVWISLESKGYMLRIIDLKSEDENTIPYRKSYLYPNGGSLVAKTNSLAVLSLVGEELMEYPIDIENFDSNMIINSSDHWNFYSKDSKVVYNLK